MALNYLEIDKDYNHEIAQANKRAIAQNRLR